MILILPQIASSLISFPRFCRSIPRVSFWIIIIVTFIEHNLFSSLARSKYLFSSLAKSSCWHVRFLLSKTRIGLLLWIGWSISISKFQNQHLPFSCILCKNYPLFFPGCFFKEVNHRIPFGTSRGYFLFLFFVSYAPTRIFRVWKRLKAKKICHISLIKKKDLKKPTSDITG